MKKSFLSLPITFSVLVNVIPYQIFIQNTQITVFNFFQQNLEHYQYYKNAPAADTPAPDTANPEVLDVNQQKY